MLCDDLLRSSGGIRFGYSSPQVRSISLCFPASQQWLMTLEQAIETQRYGAARSVLLFYRRVEQEDDDDDEEEDDEEEEEEGEGNEEDNEEQEQEGEEEDDAVETKVAAEVVKQEQATQ